ncbi:hypothetical protein [Bombilactobacillus bombi]|uniref:hypothetical protein n=1 Tax=Bombilactobacillus bombi TaxID=1303590 RepID=UPI0015E61BA6|nr:hypothetical protein [Bombilactobacillus bombi]MBA1434616.1 hypothetical protein [Bombilactobacillus bombi]
MFGFHKKDQLDLSQHDFAKITAQLRKDSKQLAKAQKQFGKLVKNYPIKKETSKDTSTSKQK